MLATANEVADHADAFAELDYNIFRGLAFASGNPIYGLIPVSYTHLDVYKRQLFGIVCYSSLTS